MFPYDNLGRLDRARSFTDHQGTVIKNSVRFRYTPLWQVAKVYQDRNGEVETTGGADGPPSGDTNVIEYGYTYSSGGNYNRVSTLTYPKFGPPAPTVETLKYGTAGSPDDRISRLVSLTATGVALGQDFAIYGYLGLNMAALVDYPVPDIQLDRTFSHDGKRRTRGHTTQTQGNYPGWDRFGRVQRQVWVDGLLTVNPVQGAGFPDRPPVVEDVYTYDKASNREGKTDARPGAKWTNRDFDFDYDSLDRLTRANRGVAGIPFANGIGGQEWDLDRLGNWGVTVPTTTGTARSPIPARWTPAPITGPTR